MLSIGYIACIFVTHLNPTAICVPRVASSNNAAFLGAFAEMLEVTISFMSLRPHGLDPQWKNFCEI
jgi:hypothetical protein